VGTTTGESPVTDDNQPDRSAVEYEPRDRDDPNDAPLDNEVDFDDETDDDQLPLDEVEALEVGINLDPERLDGQ
jgi:hypothetical protein